MRTVPMAAVTPAMRPARRNARSSRRPAARSGPAPRRPGCADNHEQGEQTHHGRAQTRQLDQPDGPQRLVDPAEHGDQGRRGVEQLGSSVRAASGYNPAVAAALAGHACERRGADGEQQLVPSEVRREKGLACRSTRSSRTRGGGGGLAWRRQRSGRSGGGTAAPASAAGRSAW